MACVNGNDVSKRDLSERDICTKFITPALRQAGWDEMLQIREEVSFTKGRIIVRGAEESVVIDPGLFTAHYNLAIALADQQRVSDAIVQCNEALRLDPDLAPAHNNLASLLLEEGQAAEALAHAQAALRLQHAQLRQSLFLNDDGTVYFLWHSGKIARLKPDMTGLAEPYRWLKPTVSDPTCTTG